MLSRNIGTRTHISTILAKSLIPRERVTARTNSPANFASASWRHRCQEGRYYAHRSHAMSQLHVYVQQAALTILSISDTARGHRYHCLLRTGSTNDGRDSFEENRRVSADEFAIGDRNSRDGAIKLIRSAIVPPARPPLFAIARCVENLSGEVIIQ